MKLSLKWVDETWCVQAIQWTLLLVVPDPPPGDVESRAGVGLSFSQAMLCNLLCVPLHDQHRPILKGNVRDNLLGPFVPESKSPGGSDTQRNDGDLLLSATK